MLLTGTFCRSIDEKQRVAVPKCFRDAFGCPEGGDLYVAPCTDGSLAIYTEESFGRLAERLTVASPTQREVREFTRLFYGSAQRAELGKEVVLVGVRDHLELWAANRWESYLAERQTHFDEIAEAAFGGP